MTYHFNPKYCFHVHFDLVLSDTCQCHLELSQQVLLLELDAGRHYLAVWLYPSCCVCSDRPI